MMPARNIGLGAGAARNAFLRIDVIEEVLRYDAPVQGIVRLTNHEVDLGDVVIPRDAVVMILFGSANRDETRWTDGDVFDVDREPQDHLGFGSGIHLCLGAPLARVEGREAIGRLVERFPNLSLVTDDVEWKPTSTIRGPAQLPLTW